VQYHFLSDHLPSLPSTSTRVHSPRTRSPATGTLWNLVPELRYRCPFRATPSNPRPEKKQEASTQEVLPAGGKLVSFRQTCLSVLVIFKRLRTQLLLHTGERLPGASIFWWYAIAVVFANVRKLQVDPLHLWRDWHLK